MAVRRFAPGPLPTVLTLVGFALLVSLGIWQLQRLAWKRGLIARVEAGLAAPARALTALPEDPAALDWHRVRVHGRLRAARNFAYRVERRDGEAGARLLTPFELADGSLILVDRGFLPEDRLPPREPAPLKREVVATITGVLRDHRSDRSGPFTPDNDPGARRFWWLDPVALRHFVGREVVPVVVVAQQAEPADVLARVAPVEVDLPNRHLGYAVTWFGLAAGLLAVYVAYGFSRGRSEKGE